MNLNVLDWLEERCDPKAPDGFRWTTYDVISEKVDSLFAGVIIGLVANGLITVVVLVVMS